MRNKGSAQHPWNDHVPIVSEMDGPVATGLVEDVVELVVLVDVARELVVEVDEVEVEDVVDVVVREVAASVETDETMGATTTCELNEGATSDVPTDKGTDTTPIELGATTSDEATDDRADEAPTWVLCEGATRDVPTEETLDKPATWVTGAIRDVLVDEVRLVTDRVVLDDTVLEVPALEGADTDALELVVEVVVEVVERLLTEETVANVVHVDEVLVLEVDVLEEVVDVVVVLVLDVVEVVD